MRFFDAALAATVFMGGAVAFAAPALADWPERPVTIIVP